MTAGARLGSFALVAALALPGCGSLVSHVRRDFVYGSDHADDPAVARFLPGTYLDVCMFPLVVVQPLFLPALLVDLPLSFVLDVAFFPAAMFHELTRPELRAREPAPAPARPAPPRATRPEPAPAPAPAPAEAPPARAASGPPQLKLESGPSGQ